MGQILARRQAGAMTARARAQTTAGRQPCSDHAVRSRPRLAGQSIATVTTARRQARRLRPQVLDLAALQLHAAGATAAGGALVGQADAAAQRGAQDGITGHAGELRPALGEADPVTGGGALSGQGRPPGA